MRQTASSPSPCIACARQSAGRDVAHRLPVDVRTTRSAVMRCGRAIGRSSPSSCDARPRSTSCSTISPAAACASTAATSWPFEEDHEESPQGRLRRFRYTIVTYRVDTPEMRIAAFPVRYFMRRAGGVQGAPAGQVIVPAAVVPIRSVIPDGGGAPTVRVPARFGPPHAISELAQSAGARRHGARDCSVHRSGASTSPAGRAGCGSAIAFAAAGGSTAESLEDLRRPPPASDAERIHAFDRLNALVREHLSLPTGINAEALTPAEIRHAVEKRAPPAGTDIEDLLTACERARYAPDPPAPRPGHDALRERNKFLSGGDADELGVGELTFQRPDAAWLAGGCGAGLSVWHQWLEPRHFAAIATHGLLASSMYRPRSSAGFRRRSGALPGSEMVLALMDPVVPYGEERVQSRPGHRHGSGSVVEHGGKDGSGPIHPRSNAARRHQAGHLGFRRRAGRKIESASSSSRTTPTL